MLEFLQERKLETGWVNLGPGRRWPSIGLLPSPKARSLHGIVFTSVSQIDEAVLFLKKARKEFAVIELHKRPPSER